MTLQEQILRRIRTQNVKPTPKGYFKARDYVLWGLLGVFVAALSLGLGMVFFLVHSTDRSLLQKLSLTFSERLVYSIPIFWILVAAVAGVLAYLNFRKTRRGYRVSTEQFSIVTAVIAVAVGSILYAFDVAHSINNAATADIPLYNKVVPLNTDIWADPEHGLLSGYIKEKDSNNSFTLRDTDFELWTVTGQNISVVPAGFKFNAGDRVKIIGKKTGEYAFQAVEIRPFTTETQQREGSTQSITE